METALAYEKLLELDANDVQLPNWKLCPSGETEDGTARLKEEHRRTRELVTRVQKKAVENLYYICSRLDINVGIAKVQQVAAKHKKTSLGKYATKLAERVVSDSHLDSCELPKWAFDDNSLEANAQVQLERSKSPTNPAANSQPSESVSHENQETARQPWGAGLGFQYCLWASGVVIAYVMMALASHKYRKNRLSKDDRCV